MFIALLVYAFYTLFFYSHRTIAATKDTFKDILLNSHCITSSDVTIKKLSDQTLESLLREAKNIDGAFKKLSSAFVFGVSVQCPNSSPLELSFRIPKKEISKSELRNMYLTTLKRAKLHQELETPRFITPVLSPSKIQESFGYYTAYFLLYKAEARNPYFVVYKNPSSMKH
ncbi:MAG: hypothetical protein HYS98_07700 [Deltaproteobacteria bacterium]|nr:hypothetical protein [Deltaproteobacteria bacterium]